MSPEELKNWVEKLKQNDKQNGEVAGFVKIPQLCALSWPPRTENPANGEVLRKLILDFQPQAGWICWQNRVSYFYFQHGKLEYPEATHLLYGEFSKPDASLHVNEDGQGGWIVTCYEESAGNTFAVTDSHFLGESKHAPAKLYYRVYWQDTKEHGFRQIAARFCGFTQ